MLRIKDINKTFNKGKEDEVRALKGIGLNISRGEFVIIIGANGSGKSTFFNILQGSLHADSGSLSLNGEDITALSEHKRSRYFSRVFQNPSQGTAPDLSIEENFRLAALRTRSKKIIIGNDKAFREEIRLKISALGMGLENKIKQPMGSLSGGQRQALSLLMGVMDTTELLLMDEPTAALDPKSSVAVLQLAEKLNKEKGLAIMLVTHNMRDAHAYGNRLLHFKEGIISKDLDSAEKSALELSEIYSWF